MTHQESCFEEMVEDFDVSTKSNTVASTTTELRPRENLEDDVEGPQRQLIRGLVSIASTPEIMNGEPEVAEQAHRPAP